jgi:hypothetical protein
MAVYGFACKRRFPHLVAIGPMTCQQVLLRRRDFFRGQFFNFLPINYSNQLKYKYKHVLCSQHNRLLDRSNHFDT